MSLFAAENLRDDSNASLQIDEPILQLAIEAQVPYIVSRNIRDFDGAEHYGIAIIQPADFLRLIRQQPSP